MKKTVNIEEQFTKFLKYHKALTAYKRNLKLDPSPTTWGRMMKHAIRHNDAGSLIMGAFYWGDTKEGVHFWIDLHRKWRDYGYNLKT